MKVVIAGSRNYHNVEHCRRVIFNVAMNHMEITEVVCGMARGVDTIGKLWAENLDIPVKKFPADWDKYGKAAGPIRNKQMADYADAAIVIYNPEISKGSINMVEQMKKLGKPVIEVKIKT